MRHAGSDGFGVSAQASLLWLAAGTLYFLLAAVTIHLTSNGLTIATVWPANAVLVALLLIGPKPRWMVVLSAGLLGNIAANWITRGSVSGPLLYSVANGVEIVIAALLIRAEVTGLKSLRGFSRFFCFILVAGFIAPVISGVIGATTASLVYAQSFGKSFVTWVVSDSLGLLVFTPVFFSIFNGEVRRCFTGRTRKKRLEAIALFALTALVTAFIFYVALLPVLFMLYAPVMLVTFRVGPLGTKIAVMIIAVIGAYATGTGSGPIAMMAPEAASQAHFFQLYLAILMLTCLPVAAEVEQRGRLAAELVDREHRAAQEASTDALTGVLNRRGFESAANIALSSETSGLYCVAIDLDHFKQINDRWGHQFGDRVLQHLSETLLTNIRSDDLVGRLGGDEFALILHGSAAQPIETICARLQAALRGSPISPDGKTEIMLGVSCGAAPVKASDRFQDVYQRADQALYVAKRAGRNTYRLAAAG